MDEYLATLREYLCCNHLGRTPAYYYGTHYSSAMIVASYMIRLEPFTQHFLRLQVCRLFSMHLYFNLCI